MTSSSINGSRDKSNPATKLRLGLSLMASEDFIAASYELFERGAVEVLEWSFDTIFGTDPRQSLPDWSRDLLRHYSDQSALLGHGVTLSLFSPDWDSRQDQWLDQLSTELNNHSYLQISEHFGFMTSPDFSDGSPMPLPYCDLALNFAIERMRRFQSYYNGPIGLENLALVFNRASAFDHGRFLSKLIHAVDGYLVLDLHNLFCLTENFGIQLFQLLEAYPLDLVKELHISGGSWFTSSSGRKLRRDTHDGPVPDKLFEWLPDIIEACPRLEFVILERINGTLIQSNEQAQFRQDYLKLAEIINR